MLRSESNALVSYLATLPFLIAWLAACWWFVTHTTQFLWDLRLRDDELVMVILNFVPVWRIPLSEISAIHKTTRFGLMKLSYGRGLTGIFSRSGPVVVIERVGRTSLIAATPKNADEFIARVQARLPVS